MGAALVHHDDAGLCPPRAVGRDLVFPVYEFASRS